jgi:hypothetical protein
MQKKKHDHRGMGRSFLGLVGTTAIASIVLSFFFSKGLERKEVEKPSGLEREVVQPVEIDDVNEPYTLDINERGSVVKGENKKFSFLEDYDNLIERNVFELNKKHNQNLDSDLIRAIIITEAGSFLHRDNAFKYDPMQIANPGSYAVKTLGNREEHTNLIGDFANLKGKRKTPRDKKGELDYSNTNMTAEDSIEGGVGWLFHKAAIYDERVIEEGPLIEYKVKSGDSFWKIAEENDSTEETLRKYNPKVVPENIKKGQKVKFKKARKEMYISGWRDWKTAVHRYGDQTPNYIEKVCSNLKELKKD